MTTTATPSNNTAISASGEVDSLLIEKFNGQVKMKYNKAENLMNYFDLQSVTGTNMVSNKYLGETDIQTMIPGQSVDGSPVEYDKNALVVDASVIARNIVAIFHDVQNDINGHKNKLAEDHAKNMKKMEDSMLIQQMIYGTIHNTADARNDTPRVKGHGFSVRCDLNDAQALDPNSLLAAIEFVIEKQLEQENEISDMVGLIPWQYYNVLSDANQIAHKDYVTAGGTEIKNGMVLKRWNLPLVPSNRFPTAVHDGDSHHNFSLASNAFRYDVTTEQMRAICVIFSPDALLVGRTIAMESDIFFDKKTKSYFIDTWMAEGAIPDRWEAVGTVFRGAQAENATIAARSARKAFVTTTLAN